MNYMKVGVKKLLRTGMMPARTWEGGREVRGREGCMQAVGMAPAERLKLRRQMAATLLFS